MSDIPSARREHSVPFYKPYLSGDEEPEIRAALDSEHLAGAGAFTEKCERWLEKKLGAARVLLTHSCTGALEMAALLLDIKPGDEIIMPSFTFVSTANAFVLRGAVPVFVDIRPDTLNLNEKKIELAITDETRAIVPVHYAGVACAMDDINTIAKRHGLHIVEDAAQAIGARHNNAALGSIGRFGALSFHATKNVIAGEAGALIVRDPADVERAEILREKGTDRTRFKRGLVDKYTWQDIGSSFLPSEVTAAFLWAQLQHTNTITNARLKLWQRYQSAFMELENEGHVVRPEIPKAATHNAHLYYLIFKDEKVCKDVEAQLRAKGVGTATHYVPLHTAPAGRRFGRSEGSMEITDRTAGRLLRLPLYPDLTSAQQEHVIRCVQDEF